MMYFDIFRFVFFFVNVFVLVHRSNTPPNPIFSFFCILLVYSSVFCCIMKNTENTVNIGNTPKYSRIHLEYTKIGLGDDLNRIRSRTPQIHHPTNFEGWYTKYCIHPNTSRTKIDSESYEYIFKNIFLVNFWCILKVYYVCIFINFQSYENRLWILRIYILKIYFWSNFCCILKVYSVFDSFRSRIHWIHKYI